MPNPILTTNPVPAPTVLRRQATARRQAWWLAVLGLVLAGTGTVALAKGNNPAQAHPAQAGASQPEKARHHRLTGRKAGAPGSVGKTAGAATRYAGKPEAEQLAREIAQRRGWDPEWVSHWIGQAQQLPGVIRLATPAPVAAAKNWAAYRARFIEPGRIEAGRRFWLEQRAALERAETSYGVPAWLIVGIIGVETYYGRHTGSYRVLDALATLSLDFPDSHPRALARQAYFRGELETLLQLSREQGVNPDVWRGSYAGAMGLPQFMPDSWLKYAVDFDGDGRIDLRSSPVDAIGSVAHYMKQHGWQAGLQTHFPVRLEVEGDNLATLLAPDIRPSFGAARLHELGARLQEPALQHAGSLALVELRNGDPLQGGGSPSYVAGTENFYAVTRYNWSSYYAMAVIELGQAVQAALGDPSEPR